MIFRTKMMIVTAILLFALSPLLSPLLAQASGFSGADARGQRTLSFFNTHTNETLNVTYWKNGRYDRNALDGINRYLRDHRTGHTHEMSYELMNLLNDLQQELKHRHPEQEIVFHVISGFRSPETNTMLRASGGGQAKQSRHMSGDAIDIRIPGIDSAEIRNIAWCMQRGGVGFYQGSDFVHVDTHKVRHWNWSPEAGMCGRTSS
ncbi:MAG: hypothetical protein CO093_01770 [Alphaproteobacteria bacterium CG_4_9_14_3_um_filter_47_13]|nr:MAG: hypothetical protein CO093_01770 [Alphaproteobacteria bacterium CG_4_9_14_3_um_filter_47_13]